MGGIKCRKCGATVSSEAATARLATSGIYWLGEKFVQGLEAVAKGLAAVADIVAGTSIHAGVPPP
ncbi:unnamed protein product, partial [Rotaria sp. Silwood1]